MVRYSAANSASRTGAADDRRCRPGKAAEAPSDCLQPERGGRDDRGTRSQNADHSKLTFGMTNSITLVMSVAKVTISIESNLLKKVDRLVKERVFSNRSQAVQAAVEEKLSRLDSNRLARECAKLNKTEEQSLADLGLASEAEEWLEY